ncbi:MAG: methylamine utilization protein [Betaproteobacteria bacterium]|nr:MAG: methylamine utilization protein [Betaproteobacteria bacterium]
MKLTAKFLTGCIALSAAITTTQAATVVAQISDRAGNPVSNAVVYVLPVGSKAPAAKAGASATVEQVGMKFEPFVSVVQAGTRMRFPNKDRAEHHLKTLSGPTMFDFQVYTKKEPEPVLFDKTGQVTLQCLFHGWMSAHIYVVDSPWFGKTAKGGSTVIEDIPAGEYDVFVTHPSLLIPTQVSPSMPRRVKLDASSVQTVQAKFDFVPKPEPSRRFVSSGDYQ